MGDQVPVSRVDWGSGTKSPGANTAKLSKPRDQHNQGERRKSAHSSIDLMPASPGACEDRAVPKGAIVEAHATRVPPPIEEILGTAFMGKRILLRDRGRSDRRDDQGVHREPRNGSA